MPKLSCRPLAIGAMLTAGMAGAAWSQAAPTYADLAPLLAERCTVCHAGDSAAAGLRLDSLDGLLKGSSRGPVVRSGDPAGSELLRRLDGRSLPRMPLTGPPYLPPDQVARFERWIAAGLPAGTPVAAAALPPSTEPGPGEPLSWLHVAPILARRCAKCHTDNGQMGAPPEGYRLTTHAAALDATDRLRVVPGQPAASELIRRVKGLSQPRMPFDGPPWLTDAEIARLERWVAEGARDGEGRPAAVPPGARIRLQGTLAADGTLDGLAIAVDGGTRIDKRPRPGDRVELRGHVDAAGRVVADRLRRR